MSFYFIFFLKLPFPINFLSIKVEFRVEFVMNYSIIHTHEINVKCYDF